ncbi:MAG: glycosyltransferase [Anaerovoracaceae bacterium]|jgi:glycosyltransferase involved in cell wall biosynthesis
MNGKKKLLIVNNNLDIGGIQKSLVNLLYELDKKKLYDIDLFLFSNSGEYKSDIPPSIKVIEGNKFVKLLGVSQVDSKKIGLLYYLLRGLAVVYTGIINRRFPIKLILKTQKKIKNYDVAISFMHEPDSHTFYGGCNEFVIDRVIAEKKITFVHCDFLNYGGNNRFNCSLYEKFDAIATVSKGCRENFIKANPKLKNKTFIVQNCQNYKEIIKKANQTHKIYEKDNFNIITVSRLSEEKGIIRTINIIEKLVTDNEKIKWHIVGSGSLESDIRSIIKSRKLEKNIIIYGNQENPYKFIKNADLFLLPSYHEAAPMVFDEAKYLGVPILTTNITSAEEMVAKYLAGWVCENSEEGIYYSLKNIIDNREELNKVKRQLKELSYNNKIPIEQFENLISNKGAGKIWKKKREGNIH